MLMKTVAENDDRENVATSRRKLLWGSTGTQDSGGEKADFWLGIALTRGVLHSAGSKSLWVDLLRFVEQRNAAPYATWCGEGCPRGSSLGDFP